MNRQIKIGCWFAAVLHAHACLGHGFPITVNTAGLGQPLVVSGGSTDSGFAEMFFDHHPDAFLDVFGAGVLGTDLPGFDIEDMEVGSQLFLEVLPRPDFSDAQLPQRWLWHWSFDSGSVEEAPDDPTLEIVDNNDVSHVLLTQFAVPTTGPNAQVAEPTSGQIGNHSHALNYLLYASNPQAGVYGFFARLTSPAYAPSQPFLVALNHGLDHSVFLEGASAINDAAGLPGDYDLDGMVSGEDLLLWQRTFGSTSTLVADGSLNAVIDNADLQIWEDNYGRSIETTLLVGPVGVPEPLSATLALVSLLISSCCRFFVRGSSARRRR